MAKAGITLEPQVMSTYQTFLARQADMYFGTGSGRPDPFDFLQAQVAANGIYNPDAYPPTPELAAVIQQISQTDPLDPKRQQLLQQASGLVVDDARVVPILALQFNWALSPCIVNFNPPTFGALQGVGMGWKSGCK